MPDQTNPSEAPRNEGGSKTGQKRSHLTKGSYSGQICPQANCSQTACLIPSASQTSPTRSFNRKASLESSPKATTRSCRGKKESWQVGSILQVWGQRPPRQSKWRRWSFNWIEVHSLPENSMRQLQSQAIPWWAHLCWMAHPHHSCLQILPTENCQG